MKRRTVLVVNPEEQVGLFEALSPSEPAARSEARTTAPRATPKARKKAKPVAKKKTKRAALCRRSPKAPKTVECEPMKRNKAGQFIASGGRRQVAERKKKRRRNPEENPRRRRRRRRRRNPEGGAARILGLGGMLGALREAVGDALPTVGAKLAISWAVKRWGTSWGEGLMGDKPAVSPYGGQAWSLRNYMIAVAVGAIGSTIASRWKPGAGRAWMRSVADDILQRLVYTEVIARSKWGQENLGADPIPIGYERNAHGDTFAIYEGTGYRPAMLGLEPAGPLGGLVPANRKMSSRAPAMGHLYPQNGQQVDPYSRAGSSNPYLAQAFNNV